MGKITVKHYLNVNLKPYIVRGESYYSMYIMVIVNRKSTNVKSISFTELYTEEDFSEIIEEDNFLLKQEISVIENICSLIVDTFHTFDASLFSLYYSSLKSIFVDSLDLEIDSQTYFNYYMSQNIINIHDFIFDEYALKKNETHGLDLFEWFSEEGQKHISKVLINNRLLPNDHIEILNKYVFLASLIPFSDILNDTKKGREIYKKYSHTMNDGYYRFRESVGKQF